MARFTRIKYRGLKIKGRKITARERNYKTAMNGTEIPQSDAHTIERLIEWADNLFLRKSTDALNLPGDPSELARILKIVARSTTASPVFNSLAFRFRNQLASQGAWLAVLQQLRNDNEAMVDLMYLKTFHPQCLTWIQDLGEILGPNSESEAKAQFFSSDLTQIIQRFESNRLQIIKSVSQKCSSRSDFTEEKNVIQRLQDILATDCVAVVSGPEFSGKSHLINQYIALSQSNGIRLTYIVIDSTTESSTLLGNYFITTDEENPQFQWRDGPLVVAAREGHLCVLENFEMAQDQLKSFFKNLIQTKNIKLKSKSLYFHPEFKLLIASRDTDFLGPLNTIQLSKPELAEFFQIIGSSIELPVSIKSLIFKVISIVHSGSKASNYFKVKRLFIRLSDILAPLTAQLATGSAFISSDIKVKMLLAVCDIFFEGQIDELIAFPTFNELVGCFELSTTEATSMITFHETSMALKNGLLATSRFVIPCRGAIVKDSSFVLTPKVNLMIEKILGGIKFSENVLLIGETGSGKTTVVQHLAKMFGKKLTVFNVSHSTDSTDLFGGHRPVNDEVTFRHEVDELQAFIAEFFDLAKNIDFINHLRNLIKDNKFEVFSKCMVQACRKILSSEYKENEGPQLNQLDKIYRRQRFEETRNKLSRILAKHEKLVLANRHKSTEQAITSPKFEFVKGVILQAIERDEWLLLDEINLANDDVLLKLYQLLFNEVLHFMDSNELQSVHKHPGFRLFACMNPAFEVGKKPLPKKIQDGFTVFQVPTTIHPDEVFLILKGIFEKYTVVTNKILRSAAEFYVAIRELADQSQLLDKSQKKLVLSLRQLRRGTNITKSCLENKDLSLSIVNAFYIGMRVAFFLDLSEISKVTFNSLFDSKFETKNIGAAYENTDFLTLSRDFKENSARSAFYGHPLPNVSIQANKSSNDKSNNNESHFDRITKSQPVNNNYVITHSVQTIILDMLKILLFDPSMPILLEGPTSSGKTSLITFLASHFNQKLVRINNHRDTDAEEYIGGYVPDASGTISFREGTLVKCMREGSWLLLDELNLARSEILEALNRVLDDNQELYIPEIDQIVKPSPGFRIFATQNPANYSGRSLLSKAFRNRFVVINFESLDDDDLLQILTTKAGMAESRSRIMLSIMQRLQNLRSFEHVFEGKEGLITVRDLLKWSNRKDQMISKEDLGVEGSLLLAERIRDYEQKKSVQEIVIHEAIGKKVKLTDYYVNFFEQLSQQNSRILEISSKYGIKWSRQFKRLFVLAYKAFLSKEAILLVGETGCGKTTLAQLFAEIFQVRFFSINCHKNTEVSDFLGAWRPFRNKGEIIQEFNKLLTSFGLAELEIGEECSKTQISITLSKIPAEIKERPEFVHLAKDLECEFQWVEGNLVRAVRNGGVYLIDEISLANDNVLERLNSLLEFERKLAVQEGNQDLIELTAHKDFYVIATMNPSGDHGKRELSPALRNRFSEIWVTSVLDYESFAEGHEDEVSEFLSNLAQHHLEKYHIQMNSDDLQSVTKLVFNLFRFANFENHAFIKPFNLRDLFSWITIFAKNFNHLGLAAAAMSTEMLFEAQLGLIGDQKTHDLIKKRMEKFTFENSALLSSESSTGLHLQLSITEANVSIGGISIPVSSGSSTNRRLTIPDYVFDEPQVRRNLLKIFLGLQSEKPLLLEGPPGVGKTSLIEQLAGLLKVTIYKINLSEHTDMIDLLGADVPDAKRIGHFTWNDGLLLRALKSGAWIIFDELNLANQTVLEGLNSILDHRGEVFLPDINQTVHKHPDFKFFGTQNPLSQGKGRKGLPLSFLNRFFRIYLSDLQSNSLRTVVSKILIKRHSKLNDFEFLFNIIFESIESNLTSKHELNIRAFRKIINFLDHFYTCASQKELISFVVVDLFLTKQSELTSLAKTVQQKLNLHFNIPIPAYGLIEREGSHYFACVNQNGAKLISYAAKDPQSWLTNINREDSHLIWAISAGIDLGFPLIIQTAKPDNQPFFDLLLQMGISNKKKLKHMRMFKAADISDLIGSYEQFNWEYVFAKYLKQLRKAYPTLSHQLQLRSSLTDKQSTIDLLRSFIAFFEQHKLVDDVQKAEKLIELIDKERSVFVWSDSELIRGIQKGHWVLIHGCQEANPAVLEKLNGILEDNHIILNESFDDNNNVREIKKHPHFRLILSFENSPQSTILSPALKNRCLVISDELFAQSRSFEDLKEKFDSFANANFESLLKNFSHRLLQLKSIGRLPTTEVIEKNQTGVVFYSNENIRLMKEFQRICIQKAFTSDLSFPLLQERASHAVIDHSQIIDSKTLKQLIDYVTFVISNGNRSSPHWWNFDPFISKQEIIEQIVSGLASLNLYNEKIMRAKFLEFDIPKESLSLQAMVKPFDYKFVQNIDSLFSLTDYNRLNNFIDVCLANITQINNELKSTSLARLSEERKFTLALFIRTFSSISPDEWIFMDKGESPQIFRYLFDLNFQAKSRFVEEVGAVYHRNFRSMVGQIFKALESVSQSQKQFNILESNSSDSHTNFAKIEEFVVEFNKTVDQKFSTFIHVISENIFTAFDNDEDENFLLLCQSSDSLPVFKAFVKNPGLQGIHEIEQFGKILSSDFKNLIEVFEPFQDLFALIRIQDAKRQHLYGSFANQFEVFNRAKFIQISKRLIRKLSASKKLNLTISEIELARMISHEINPDLGRTSKQASVNFSDHQVIRQAKETIAQSIQELRRLTGESLSDSAKEITFEEFLFCVKYSIKQELNILELEAHNLSQPYEHIDTVSQIVHIKDTLKQFLAKLSAILQQMFSRTIFFNSRKGDIANSSVSNLIGEMVYNNGRSKVLSAYKAPNAKEMQRIHDFLMSIVHFFNENNQINSRTKDDLVNEIVGFFFEMLTNYQLIFSEVLPIELFDILAGIVDNHFSHVVRTFDNFSLIEYAANQLKLKPTLPLLILLHEAKYREVTSTVSGLTESLLKHKLRKIESINLELNESFKEVNKKTISEAARVLKLEAHFEKLASYEYEKKTVEKNRQKLNNEFLENFHLHQIDTYKDMEPNQSDPQNDGDKTSFWKVKQRFHKLCDSYWKYFIIQASGKENLSPHHDLDWSTYLATVQQISDFEVSANLQAIILKSLTDHLINGASKIDVALPKLNLTMPFLITDPRQEVLLHFINDKIKSKTTPNFYNDPAEHSHTKTFSSLLQNLIVSLKVFYLDTDFKELPSFVALLKACKVVSRTKADSSPAQLATATELLIKNLNEFNASLPSTMKLTQQVQILTKLLVDLRRTERHSWKNFLQIKRHEKMDDDFVSFLQLRSNLEKAPSKEKLILIDSFLKESTLLTFAQRCCFVDQILPNIKEPRVRKIAVNLVRYYSAYLDQMIEAVNQISRQVEEPMRNASKLMNWQFEDIIRMRLNIEKFYRAINRCIKSQEEALGVNFYQTVMVAHRSNLLFESLKGMKDNIEALLIARNSNIKKKILSKNLMEKLLGVSPDFAIVSKQEAVSYFRLVSAKKFCTLMNAAKTNYIPKYKSSSNLKKSLSTFMKSYLGRMEDLQTENNRSYKLRALVDFLKDLSLFGLKSRVNFNREMTYGNIFQSSDLVSITEFPCDIANAEFKKNSLSKLRKLNIRFCRIVDSLKTFLDNANYSQELEPVFREKIMSYLMSLFNKYSEHQRIAKSIFSFASKINEMLTHLSNENNKDIRKALFIVDNNLALNQREVMLTNEEKNALEKLPVLLQSNRLVDARAVLTGPSDDSAAMAIETESTPEFSRIRSTLLSIISEIEQRTHSVNSSVTTSIDKEYIRLRKHFKGQLAAFEKRMEEESSANVLDSQESMLKTILNFMFSLKKSVSTTSGHSNGFISLDKDTAVLLNTDLSVKLIHVLDWIYVFNKFVYFCAITFTNLIYKGFCTIDKDEAQKPVKGDEFETEIGTGIGEGRGEENVTGELDFEEQVLGTKNQQQQEEEDENQDDLDADEEEMEMENDFDGTTDRKKKEKEKGEDDKDEDPKEDPNKAQDEFENVDEDEPDYKLFQDEEDEEEEEQEQEEKEGMREAEDLELNADNLNKKNEKQQAKEDNDKDIRNLDKEGVTHNEEEENNSDAEMKTEEQENDSEGSVQQNEEFNQDLPADKLNEEENDQNEDDEQGSFEIDNMEIPETGGMEEEIDEGLEEENNDTENIENKAEPEIDIPENPKSKEENAFEANQDQAALNQNDQKQSGATQRKENTNVEDDPNAKRDDKIDPNADQEAIEKKIEEKIKSIFSQDLAVDRKDIKEMLENVNITEDQDEPEDNLDDTANPKDYTLDKQKDSSKQNSKYSKLKAYDKKRPTDQNDIDQLEDLEKPELFEQEDKEDEQEQKQGKKDEPGKLTDKFTESLLKKRTEEDAEKQDHPFEPIPSSAKKVKPDAIINPAIESNSFYEVLKEFSTQEQHLSDSDAVDLGESLLFLHAETNRLCEELKSILEQKKMTDLKGDYRTGKRLNIKRIISYIASNYRKDKIWLRRTEPSERDYRILVAVDDSLSMK